MYGSLVVQFSRGAQVRFTRLRQRWQQPGVLSRLPGWSGWCVSCLARLGVSRCAHGVLSTRAAGYQRRAGEALAASGPGTRPGGWKLALALTRLRLTHLQAGLNIMGFCKDFNAKTQAFKVGRPKSASPVPPSPHSSEQDGVPLPVLVTAYKDRSFDFVRTLSLYSPRSQESGF